MVEVMYLKSPSKTDHYIADENFMRIVSISKDHLYVMAEDEGAIDGAYKVIKIHQRIFEKMEDLSVDDKRKELTNILKEVHNKNKEILENQPLQLRIEESRYDHDPKFLEQKKQSFIDHYNKSEPILD